MKLFVASDIHGSLYYCKKMLEKFDEDNYDYLVLLGDILYHGPRNDLSMEYDTKVVRLPSSCLPCSRYGIDTK